MINDGCGQNENDNKNIIIRGFVWRCILVSKAVFITTIKSNTRSIVSWLVLLASFLLSMSRLYDLEEYLPRHFHKFLFGCAEANLWVAVPVFVGVISSVDILRDRKNRFLDTCRCAGLSMRRYYVGKIGAYMIMAFFAEMLFAYVWLVYYLALFGCPSGYTVSESIGLVFERVAFCSLSSVPVYTALAVCTVLLAKDSSAGIISVIVFSNLVYLVEYRMTYFGDFIYPIPEKIAYYFYFVHTHALPEAVIHVELIDVLISYAWGFAIAAVLFITGYLRLRRLNDK